MSDSIVISAHVGEKIWAVVCLSYEGVIDGTPPPHIMIDDVCCVLVGYACDRRGEYPIYLHVTGMTRIKQKFMMSTAFCALKDKGYTLRGA